MSARTGAILAVRRDGAAVVHAAGQRVEIPAGDVAETRVAAVTGLMRAASAAGAPIATLIVESATVRAAIISGDGFDVDDALDAETTAAIDVEDDGTVHVQLHGLQVDVEGEDVRVAALTLVADVAAALERGVDVTATEAGVVRRLQVSPDGAVVLPEPEEPTTEAPAPKPQVVKAARARRGRPAPVPAPVEPITATTPTVGRGGDAVRAAGEPATEVDAEPVAADQDGAGEVAGVEQEHVDAAGPAPVPEPVGQVLKVVDVVEVPVGVRHDEVDAGQVAPVKASAGAPTSAPSQGLVTVPADAETSEPPTRARRFVQRARQTTTVVALVAVIAGLTAAGISGVEATTHSDALARYALVSTDLGEVRDEVRATLEEAQALGDLSAQVADESTTDALASAIEQASELVDSEDVGAGTSWRYWTTAALDEQTDAVAAQIAHATTILRALEGAVRAVNASHEAWALEQDPAALADAITALTGAITAAAQVLAESDGRVGDNDVRQALADAIAAATAVRDTAPAADTPASERAAAAAAARAQTTALGAAQQAVTTARTTWEATQQDPPSAQQPTPGTENTPTGSGRDTGSSTAGAATASDSGAFTVDAAAVPPSADRPGVATVQVVVSGNAGESAAVLLTVAGITTQIATVSGSGVVTGSAEGLPTGTWPWHVTVAGLQASGTPDIRVY